MSQTKKPIYLFSKSNPKGEMLRLTEDEVKQHLDSGEWFDTPARLNLPKENKTGITVEQAEEADPMHLKKMLEGMGFIVLTPEQLKAEAAKMADVALDMENFSDEDLIAEAERRGLKQSDESEPDELDAFYAIFKDDPEALTKEELKRLGNERYGLNLKMTHSESTMISEIQSAVEATKAL